MPNRPRLAHPVRPHWRLATRPKRSKLSGSLPESGDWRFDVGRWKRNRKDKSGPNEANSRSGDDFDFGLRIGRRRPARRRAGFARGDADGGRRGRSKRAPLRRNKQRQRRGRTPSGTIRQARPYNGVGNGNGGAERREGLKTLPYAGRDLHSFSEIHRGAAVDLRAALAQTLDSIAIPAKRKLGAKEFFAAENYCVEGASRRNYTGE